MRWAIAAAAIAAAVLVFFYVYTGLSAALSSLSGVGDASPDASTAIAPRAPSSPPVALTPSRSAERAQGVVPAAATSAAPSSDDPPAGGNSMARLLRKQVTEGLEGVRSRLASCPDSREGRQGRAPAVLILELLARDGAMEIVEVPREKHGLATESFMSCARAVLRGRVIPVQGAKSGTRMHLAFHLALQE